MYNVSGFGFEARITASKTFPNGFTVTEFPDDADPLDSPDFTAADTAMGTNGDMIVWSRPAGIEVAFAVIPGSPGDTNLEALLNANRVGKGKQSARDQVGIVLAYPDSTFATLTEGVIVVGSIIKQVASAGRIKTRVYRFRFGNVTKTGTPVTA
jgi:hypothetical protein